MSLEEKAISSNIARAERAIENELNQLTSTTYDWAVWDSTYRFAQGRFDGYIDENLDVETFAPFGLDLVLFLNDQDQLLWGMLFTDETVDRKLLDELGIRDEARSTLLTHDSSVSIVEGYIATRFGPLVVSSRPIVDNDRVLGSVGTLIFGYFLDNKHLETLSDRIEVDLAILPMDSPEVTRLNDSNATFGHRQVETDTLRIDYIEQQDLRGDPLMVLRVQTPRGITALGQNTLSGTLLSLAVLASAAAAVIWAILLLIVVRPLRKLTHHINEIEKSGDMTQKLEFAGNDEISQLALAFSAMQIALVERDNEIRESVENLEYQATHDALTGLSNRRILYDQLEALNDAESIGYSVCILDLDGFKSVNDTSGHAAGDALLVQVATLLVEAVYDTDTVIRLGGDEFALILHDCEDDTAQKVCERIRREVESLVFCWEDLHHRIGVSIGVLSVSSSFGNVSEILQQADAACFSAKERGRNNVYMVSDDAPKITEKRREQHWAKRLATAIDNDQFLLFTQAIVPLQEDSRSEPDQLEVLVRLRDFSSKKLIPPGAFVPPAERYKLSSNIDRWVLTQILKYMTVYADVFDDSRKYWVNLSSNSLADGEFTSFLETSIRNSNIKPGRLNFEIAESSAMQNVTEVAKVMNRLKSIGCQFALDDFGTGFSSFNHLQSLPIDYLKIDGLIVRKILHSPIDRMFVKSIIDIAQAMKIKTIAEFVEQDDLIDEVTDLGADYGQGFALGRPQELMPSNHRTESEEAAG